MADVDSDNEETTPAQTLLLEAMGHELAPHGFAFEPAVHRFCRRRDGVTDRFSLVFNVIATGGCRVQPHASVRIERVEDIFHQTSGFERKHQKGTPTVGGAVGSLLGGQPRDCQFEIKAESQIPGVVQKLLRVFRDVALPYYEKFGSLKAIDAALNDKPGDRVVHFAVAWFRCSKGLIVAKLVGRANYDQLARFYLEVVQKDNKGFYTKWFGPLLKSLETVQPQAGDEH